MISKPVRDTLRPRDLVLVALLAVLPRLALTAATLDAGLFADMFEYDIRARQMLAAGTIADAWRGPGYPGLLAALYALPGSDLLAARVGNALLGGIMAALTSVLATALVGRSAAIASGVIVALYPGLILSSVYVMPEPLFTCLLLASLIAARIVTPQDNLAAGVAAGLAALTRSLGMSLVPAIVAGNILHAWRTGGMRRVLLPSAIMPIVFLIAIAPWLAHTARVSGGPMLDSSSPFNMLAGNNPRATGRLEIPDLQWMLDTYLADVPDEAVRNARAMRHSVEWAVANPSTFLRLAPIKIGYLWGLEGREHAWVYTNAHFGPRSGTTVWLWGVMLLVTFPILAVAAAFGLCRPGLTAHVTGWHILMLLCAIMTLHVISFGESRYHLPLVPVLAILAARAISHHEPYTMRAYVGAAAITVPLVIAWISQLPVLLAQLARLAARDGWQSGLPY